MIMAMIADAQRQHNADRTSYSELAKTGLDGRIDAIGSEADRHNAQTRATAEGVRESIRRISEA